MYDWLHVLSSVALLCHLLLLIPLFNWNTPSVFTLNLDLRMRESMRSFVISPDSDLLAPFHVDPSLPHTVPSAVCPVMSLASEPCWAVVTGSFCYSCWFMWLLGIECSISFFSPTLQLPAMSSVFLFRSRVPLCALGWPRTRCAEFGCSFSLPLAGKKHTGTSGSVCLMVSVF